MENSDFIVYADESGDHSLEKINSQFPLFVLALCVFRKDEYCGQVVSAVHNFKFRHFGHDAVILHEAEIRKSQGPFSFLLNESKRAPFFVTLDLLVRSTPFSLIATAIKKESLKRQYSRPEHVYYLAAGFCLERLHKHLIRKGQGDRLTHVVFESRGREEDRELELQFRRICDGQNYASMRLPFEIIIVDKRSNSPGLQIADLVARPVARHVLDPSQLNRAWEGIAPKFDCRPGTTNPAGYGLKIFP